MIYITGKVIVSNEMILEKAGFEQPPTIGWQYPSTYNVSTGERKNYQYIFATWNGKLDFNFPPNVQDRDTNVTYWYEQMGNGVHVSEVIVSTLLLGGEGSDAIFVSDNPIETVNGQPCTDLIISTSKNELNIVAKEVIQQESFHSWISLGTSSVNDDARLITVPKDGFCVAIATYSTKKVELPKFKEEELPKLFKYVSKEEMIADYLNERLHVVLDKVAKYTEPSTSPDSLSKLFQNTDISQKAARKALMKIRTDQARLKAIEQILNSVTKK